MPEIKGGGKGLEGFTPSSVDPDTGKRGACWVAAATQGRKGSGLLPASAGSDLCCLPLPRAVRFKDKGREKQRQAVLKQRQKQQQDAPQQQKQQQKQRQAAQVRRGEVVGVAATACRAPCASGSHAEPPAFPPCTPRPLQQPEVHLPAAKRRKQREREEAEELDNDYKLLKKLKRGKITAREFDIAAGLTDSDGE